MRGLYCLQFSLNPKEALLNGKTSLFKLSLVVKKRFSGFPIRSDINPAAQSPARGLKFQI